MENSIGIDVGATKIIFGLLRNRKVIKKIKIATPKTRKKFIAEIKEKIKYLTNFQSKGDQSKIEKINKIGLGIPGILNYKKGLILKCPNLGYLNNFSIVKVLENKLGAKVFIENDANCFALAEATLGVGKNNDIVFGITLGSGVGSGLIIKSLRKSKIYSGSFGGAGEIGHTIIKVKNTVETEELCSEKFFQNKGLNSLKEALMAKEGNKKSLEIYQEFGKNLGIILANIINTLDPEIIIIGGGISNAWKYFLPETKKEARNKIFSPLSKKYTKIKISKLKETAGVIGAGLIANSI